jgi:hypothetical protein
MFLAPKLVFSRILPMAKKLKHGGKREGAGRPVANPEGATVTVTATVPEGLVDQLDEIARDNDWGRSEAVTRAIRAFVAGPKLKAKG